MLAQGLAIAVAIGSILLFLTAFLFPKLHRQDDFFWSAVGLFYALVLWSCAGQMVGAVLLGQLASVILLGWFAWETLRLRQAIIDPTKIPNLDKVSLTAYVGAQLKARRSSPASVKVKPSAKSEPEKVAPETPTATSDVTPESEAAETPVQPQSTAPEPEVIEPEVAEPTVQLEAAPEPEATTPEPESVATTSDAPEKDDTLATTGKPAPKKEKRGFSFGGLFGGKKSTVSPVVTAPDISISEETPDTDIETIFAESEPEAGVEENQDTEGLEVAADVIPEATDVESDVVIPEAVTELDTPVDVETMAAEVVAEDIPAEVAATEETATEVAEAIAPSADMGAEIDVDAVDTEETTDDPGADTDADNSDDSDD